MSDWSDWYRLINIALAATALVFGIYSARTRWTIWNRRTRIGVEAILAFSAACLVGSVSHIATDDAPANAGTVLATVALVWANLALYPFRRLSDDLPPRRRQP